MKKYFFSALFLGLAFTSFAQDLYIKPYAGYGLGFDGEFNAVRQSDSNQTVTRTALFNHGAGIQGGLSLGLLFDDGLGVDFDLSYQNNLGQTITSRSGDREFSRQIDSYSIRFTPSLHFELDRASVRPYLDVGPTLMYSSFKYTSKTTFLGEVEREQTRVYEGNLTVGASSNLGVEFELSRNVFLNTAVRYVMAYSSPNRSKVVMAKDGGEDVLGDYTTYEREVQYVDEYKSEPIDPDSPAKRLKYRLNYSSVSLLVGLKFVID